MYKCPLWFLDRHAFSIKTVSDDELVRKDYVGWIYDAAALHSEEAV